MSRSVQYYTLIILYFISNSQFLRFQGLFWSTLLIVNTLHIVKLLSFMEELTSTLYFCWEKKKSLIPSDYRKQGLFASKNSHFNSNLTSSIYQGWCHDVKYFWIDFRPVCLIKSLTNHTLSFLFFFRKTKSCDSRESGRCHGQCG